MTNLILIRVIIVSKLKKHTSRIVFILLTYYYVDIICKGSWCSP